MTNHTNSHNAPDGLDNLVEQLLECGAFLGQMISGMVAFEARGRPVPDQAPIPEVAHSLIRDTLVYARLPNQYSKRDISVAANIVKEATEAMFDNIFAVSPEWIDSVLDGSEMPDSDGPDLGAAQ